MYVAGGRSGGIETASVSVDTRFRPQNLGMVVLLDPMLGTLAKGLVWSSAWRNAIIVVGVDGEVRGAL